MGLPLRTPGLLDIFALRRRFSRRVFGEVAQLAERVVRNDEFRGTILLCSTKSP
ncbi:MAG: hypothetical protein RL128_195, partial [Pseudomonadota bacterium]